MDTIHLPAIIVGIEIDQFNIPSHMPSIVHLISRPTVSRLLTIYDVLLHRNSSELLNDKYTYIIVD
jgi:hypothetical protein